MTIAAVQGSQTVDGTEWSLVTDTSYTNADLSTDDAIVQLFLDLNALAAGDEFELKGYEKVESAGTERVFLNVRYVGVQPEPHTVLPAFVLMNGWDFTLKKIAGTDRAIGWSIRKVS